MEDKINTLFVGVDIHKETHTLVGTDIACQKLCELTFENDITGFRKALDQVSKTASDRSLKPLMSLEDASGNGHAFARFLFKSGLRVKTVDPVYVNRIRKYNTHPEKSDPQDAYEIAIVSIQRTDRLPDFTLTQESEFAKDVAVLIKDREGLVCEQTKLKNKLHWALQMSWGIAYKKVCQKNIFGKRALAFWDRYPSAQDFKRTTRPIIEKPEWIVKSTYDDLPPVRELDRKHIKRLISRLRMFEEQIKEIETELEELAKENYPYLLSYPGCGVITASKFIAYVKDISRFPSEKQLARYAGIAPRKCESGKVKRDIASTRGHSALRRAFKTVALSQIGRRGNQKAKEYFRKKVKEGKTKQEALKCLMRQNVKIIFKVMKERRPYY